MQTDQELLALGVKFSEVIAVAEQVPEPIDMPDWLTEQMADTAKRVASLPALTGKGRRIKSVWLTITTLTG